MQNTASSSGVKKGLFIIPYAQLSNYQTGVNLNGSKDYVKMYLKNCCVAALSAVFNAGASTDVALVTNFDIPAEYRDLLYANHVIHMKIPFDLFDFGAEYKWSLAFYKLCVGKLSSQVQHRFADKLYRGKVVQTLSWPVVDQIQDSIQLRVRNLCEISSSWKEETKKPVHILVAASLPGRMCIRKINLNFQGLFQFPEAKEFCSVI